METPTYASPPLGVIRPRLSGACVTSMVLGILLCVPLVTNIAAILFAIAGFRATRGGAKRGRGMAITGLVLGIAGLLIWAGIGAFISVLISGSAAPRAVLHDFAKDLVAGNLAAAGAKCDASITEAQLKTVHAYCVPFGAYSDLTCTGVYLNSTTGGPRCQLGGIMHFATGVHSFTAILIKNSAGEWTILGFHVI